MKSPGMMAEEVLRSLGRKPATHLYPAQRPDTPDHFRGQIQFTAEKCIGCRMCMRDCPANAIFITKVGDKRFECQFYLDRCIYCAQCVDTCPKDALQISPNFELAQLSRDKLKVTFHAPPPPPAVPPAAPTAGAAAKPAGNPPASAA